MGIVKKIILAILFALLAVIGLAGDEAMERLMDKIQSLPVCYWEGIIYGIVFVLGMGYVLTFIEKRDRPSHKCGCPVVDREKQNATRVLDPNMRNNNTIDTPNAVASITARTGRAVFPE